MKLISEKELAALLAKDRRTIAKMRSNGEIKPVHVQYRANGSVNCYQYDSDQFQPVENSD